MAADTDAEMKIAKIDPVNVDVYRKYVQTYINLHIYSAALFWADKVVALTNGNPKDVYLMAQCMFLLKQYHRAAHLLRSRNLDKTYILCNYLTVQCLLEANELNEALKVCNSIDMEVFLQTTSCSTMNASVESAFFDDTPKHHIRAAYLLLKGKLLEAMDNRGLAADCYKEAIKSDIYCYEAFESLIKHQMLSATEENELLNSLSTSHLPAEEAEILIYVYKTKLKKYHTPSDINFIKENSNHKSTKATSTPRFNFNTSQQSDDNKIREQSQVVPENVWNSLQSSLDIAVAKAEALYYNCEYQQCSLLTQTILKQDPYHSGCLPIHISCQVELKQSNKLFTLAHNLVDLYPNLAISWFAVGCYYYIIGKSDNARRFLAKATCLDRLFGPAWLAYGHSFAIENEHDQAMAAYFKAAQLMKGCHLPLLYIGLECGLTNNVKLAEKFFEQAEAIAPDDPFVMHEMGVIAFQNSYYSTAEKHFKDALQHVDKHKRALLPQRWEPLLNNLGHTCRKLRKYDEALEYHKQALILSPQSASTFSAIAYVYALMGRTEESVDWFHKALGLRRDDTFSSSMLNYVIQDLLNRPAYPDAPEEIPDFVNQECVSNLTIQEDVKDSEGHSNVPSASASASNMSEMSMSIETDLSEINNVIKE